MIADEPFTPPPSDDRTVIRPVPGGKRADLRAPTNPNQQAPLLRFGLGNLNPIEKAASGLLSLLTRLSTSAEHLDLSALKKKVSHEIQEFQTRAQSNGVDIDTIYNASYVLCTATDEAIMNTPSDNNDEWSKQTLLGYFHKENQGGEKFFELLRSLSQSPDNNRNLLELMYLLLALGFQGCYRGVEDGKNKLTKIRTELFTIIQQERGESDQTLSPHWQGVVDRRNVIVRHVPLWVFGVIAAAFLACVFSLLLFNLNDHSDQVFKDIYQITPVIAQSPPIDKAPTPAPFPVPATTPDPLSSLSSLLESEIRQGKVKINETVSNTIMLLGDNLFQSGSASINQSLLPLLEKISESIKPLQYQVLITGHTDNKPIRNTRYPSNWHLSLARANALANVMKQHIKDPDRIVVEGKSDLEPIVSNDTPEGRARNRRVEITLLK